MPKTELEQLRAIIKSYGTIRRFARRHKISESFISHALRGKVKIGTKIASIIASYASPLDFNADLKTAMQMGAKSDIANPFSNPDLRKCFDYGRKTKEVGA